MFDAQVVVLAKQPLAGRTKTRLCPPLTPEQAAGVARAALLDTLDVVSSLAVRRRIVVLDGSPVGLVPGDFDVVPQRGGGLDERLAWAFADTFASACLPTLLIGMDTPQVTTGLLQQAVERLLSEPAVLGPAEDGGWWALGLHAPDPQVFLGVPMSASDTGAQQQRRLRERGMMAGVLPALRDIDLIEDLRAVAAEMPPSSRLVQVARDLEPVRAVA